MNKILRWVKDNCPPINLNDNASEVVSLAREHIQLLRIHQVTEEANENLRKRLSVAMDLIDTMQKSLNTYGRHPLIDSKVKEVKRGYAGR